MERRGIEALLAARQELGPTYDAALVESFADRVERALDEKVGSDASTTRRHREMLERRQMIFQFVLGAASMVAAFPISMRGVTAAVPGAAGRAWSGSRGDVAHAQGELENKYGPSAGRGGNMPPASRQAPRPTARGLPRAAGSPGCPRRGAG